MQLCAYSPRPIPIPLLPCLLLTVQLPASGPPAPTRWLISLPFGHLAGREKEEVNALLILQPLSRHR